MDHDQNNMLDLEALRARLREADAPEFWRSLDELADTQVFQDFLEDEFPQQARPLRMEMDRRQFMMLSGASLALAGLAGCRWQPQAKIVPYIKAPEDIVHGKQLFYATSMPMGGYGRGLLVESNEGRPTKIEGNPDHPATLGSSDIFMQAATLTLYDPDRLRNVQSGNDISTWETFLSIARTQLAEQRKKSGSGLRILTENITSPTLTDQINALLTQMPEAKWIQYEAIGLDSVREGANLAFGQVVNTIYQFSKAERVLAIDSDVFFNTPGNVRYARDFSDKRRVWSSEAEMNRLYAVESTPTLTGAMADHKAAMRASDIEAFTAALAVRLGATTGTMQRPTSIDSAFFEALAEDLLEHKGRSIVIAGNQQTPAVHALVHAINVALNNVGTTVVYTDPIEAKPVYHIAELRQLTEEMQQGKVEMLLILGGNPAYSAPADINFAARLAEVPFTAHLSLYYDETAARCKWALPEAHFLEAWSDVRAYDGTASIIQPLIAPLYEGRSAHEVLAAIQDDLRSGYDIVRAYWKRQTPTGTDFETYWGRALNDGLFPASAAPTKQVALRPDFATALGGVLRPPTNPQDIELIFAPDPTIWDGRFANNGWLQELPKPLSKLTWDNALIMGATFAQELGVKPEEMVRIEYQGRSLDVPVWISFGHPNKSATLHLGYGRERGGEKSAGIGFNANKLRTSDAPWFGTGAKITKLGTSYKLATTENHHVFVKYWDKDPNKIDSQHTGGFKSRELIRLSDISEYRQQMQNGGEEHGGGQHKEGEHSKLNMFPEVVGEEGPNKIFKSPYSYDYKDPDINQWGMAIDMNTCIGCGVCTIACQAENNIPVVGKDQVLRGREMHWIRVDRYYNGDLDSPDTYFQPVTCMHCELAPCEPVCPVAATVHSHDGLNQMVYNRCIGTKYCSNNCPYKVRRFNFLNYANRWEQPVVMLRHNPDVTVRSRGVMEKCTYCTQRISRARIEAKKENRKVGGDEVVTACQQACPTNAIIFGDINDPNSKVAKAKALPGDYTLLEELNVRPRTSYLKRLRNPNPKLGGKA
jgi:molybdopterin-containing oxidoreductase family iron-sulfur binding subunit